MWLTQYKCLTMKQLLTSLGLIFLMACFSHAECAIGAKSVSASVTLADQGRNNYDAINLLDQNQKTIWAATFSGSPITLTLIPYYESVVGVYIRNGYQRDQKSLTNNSRAKRVKVYLNDKQHLAADVVLKDVNRIPKLTYNPEECDEMDGDGLCNESSYEYIDFGDYAVFQMGKQKIKKIILEIVSVYPGDKWNDLCIADIVFLGGC